MGKAPAGSVKDTGAPANAILVGVKTHNQNLKVKVHAAQPPGDGGKILGSFDVLEAGNGAYAGYLKAFEGRSFHNVQEFFSELNARDARAAKATHLLNRNTLKILV